MNSEQIANFKQALIKNGQHVTKARLETFKSLVSDEPQSMSEVLSKAKGKVDRVTVYRNVVIFEKLGIVHRIYIGWKYKLELSDQFLSHHHHLSCINCGKVIDIEDDETVDSFINTVSKKFGFRPRNHQFEIDGYCKDCSKPKQ